MGSCLFLLFYFKILVFEDLYKKSKSAYVQAVYACVFSRLLWQNLSECTIHIKIIL